MSENFVLKTIRTSDVHWREGMLGHNGVRFCIAPIGYKLTPEEVAAFERGEIVSHTARETRQRAVVCDELSEALWPFLSPFIGKHVRILIAEMDVDAASPLTEEKK
jgi:hypothetical protein